MNIPGWAAVLIVCLLVAQPAALMVVVRRLLMLGNASSAICERNATRLPPAGST